MCPFCWSTIGLVVAGTVSTGGFTALAVKLSRKNKNDDESNPKPKQRSSTNEKSDQNVEREIR